jgi:hypothetical protein
MIDTIPSPFRWAGIWSASSNYQAAELVWVPAVHVDGVRLPGGFYVGNGPTTANGMPPNAEGALHLEAVRNWGLRQGRLPVIIGSWTRLPEGAFTISVPREEASPLNWRSDWSSSGKYSPGDIVRIKGQLFVARQLVLPSEHEPVQGDQWDRLTSQPQLQFRGDWNAETIYQSADIVTYGNSWYSALTDNVRQTAPTDSSRWKLIAEFTSADAVAWASLGISSIALLTSGIGAAKDIMEMRQMRDLAQRAADATRIAAQEEVVRLAQEVVNMGTRPTTP